MKKGEINVPAVVLSILLGITLILFLAYLLVVQPDYTEKYLKRLLYGEIKDPLLNKGLINESQSVNKNLSVDDYMSESSLLEYQISNLTEEEFINLEKEAITYILIFFKAYNLHNPPLSSNTPKIQFQIGSHNYNSEIIFGEIYTNSGEIPNPDIKIKTSKEEFIKMVFDYDYLKESINSEKSSIDLVKDKTELYLKGYNELYSEMFG